MSERRGSLEERMDAWTVLHPHARGMRQALAGPLLLWRVGLGPLLSRRVIRGGRLVVLTVTGRKTGAPRHLPVVVHEIGDRTYLWCPYGSRARWFRNVEANPLVTVQSHRGARPMRAVPVEGLDEVHEVVADLRQFDAVFLRSYLDSEGIPDTPEGIAGNADRLHLRWLVPTDEVGPPGQAADLRWVWFVKGVGVVVGVRFLVRFLTRRRRP